LKSLFKLRRTKETNITDTKIIIMKIGFAIVLIILSFCSCNKKPDLTENEIYTILNEIITDDSLKIERVSNRFLDVALETDYLNDFSESDIKFIKREREIFKDFKIDSTKLKLFRPKRKCILISLGDTIIYKGSLTEISFPFISIDRKKVLIRINHNVDVFLGGSGGTYLYEKKNGHWVKMKNLNHWLSYYNRMDSYPPVDCSLHCLA